MIFLLLLAELTWRERAPLPLPRAGYAIGVVDQRMLFAGGSYWEADRKIVSRRSDFFDPATNTWIAGPELPAPRCDAPSATSGGHVYIFGGVVDGHLTDSVLQYRKGAWLEPSSMKLPDPRMYALATSAGKSLYVFGGLSKMGDLSSATSTLWRWQDGHGWSTLAPFPGVPRVIAALVAHHDHLYVFGGLAQSRNLSEVWSYDIKANTWKQLADLPVARRAWSAVSDGKNILLLGGYTDAFSDEVFLFDTKTAKPFGRLAHPLADAKYVIVGDRLLTAGGESGIKIRAPWTLETTLSQGKP